MDPILPRPRSAISPAAAALLLFAFATLLRVAYAGFVPLSPQEAYYWQYARHPALSYFDHPPAAAWTIRATTALFGDGERAIRLAAAAWSGVFFLFLFLSARRLFGGRVALVASAVILVTPFFSLGQTIITPDAPLVGCWMAAFYFTVRALDEERGAWLLLAGAATGVASLGKYTGFLLAPQIFLALLLDPRGRPLLRTAWPYLGLAVASLLFLPVLEWNRAHGWASFAFQFAGRGRSMRLEPVLVGRFLGLQALVVSPVLLVALLAALAGAARRLGEPSMRLCAIFSAPLLAILAAVSPFHWVKMNWAVCAYPTALIAAAAFYAAEPRRFRPVLVGAVAVAALSAAYLALMPLVPALPFPARDATTEGWKELAARVEREQGERPGMPVVGCFYRIPSALAYYLPGRPATFSSNAFGEAGLAYDYWEDPATLAGREVLVVLDDRDSEWCRRRTEQCRPLVPLEPLVVRRGTAVVTTFRLWRCGYLGPGR
ncbi:MAG TPA: glycosyltransferase family 39 protein [Anaeromyxobacteraceae bacterium]|nr:glycosyltransferase family 39 protein [Anaeromyxobacteraceae bacterium]